MARIWVDNRDSWFFQALVTSSKLDSMAENEHRLMSQAGHIFSDWLNGDIDSQVSTVGAGVYIELNGIAVRDVQFAATIRDDGPWDRITLDIYVKTATTVTGPNVITLRYYDNAGAVDLISHTVVDGSDYRATESADITGLPSQVYNFSVVYDSGFASTLVVGPAAISLTHSLVT